ncbi:MAG: hypothetical protein AAF492_30425, partial [Verrucomicrobiota bacterium]
MYKRAGGEFAYDGTQREIIDMVHDGVQLRVARIGTRDWIDGEVFAVEGDEAFPDRSLPPLTRKQTERRSGILVLYNLWAVPASLFSLLFAGFALVETGSPVLVVLSLLEPFLGVEFSVRRRLFLAFGGR